LGKYEAIKEQKRCVGWIVLVESPVGQDLTEMSPFLVLVAIVY
jgi:hypothetical protein